MAEKVSQRLSARKLSLPEKRLTSSEGSFPYVYLIPINCHKRRELKGRKVLKSRPIVSSLCHMLVVQW